jgi:mannose-6-phosphate isomerase-like protein (cupin superfamily)
LVLEGQAQIQVGADRFEVGPRQAVLAPAGSDHGVTNAGAERLVLYVFVAQDSGGAPSSKAGHQHDHGHRH